MNFRNINVQNIFQSAAQCQYIHILATIDHIHGPLSTIVNFDLIFTSFSLILVWNQQSLTSFRWIWYAVHTW
jgi:hypothetical protein